MQSIETSIPLQNKFLRRAEIFVAWSPWLFLITFSLFVLLVTLQVGHLPTYGRPDPKFAGPVSLLYIPANIFLVIAVMMTPIGISWSAYKIRVGFSKSKLSLEAIFCLVGLGLFWTITKTDAFGLMNWLAD